MHQNIEQAGKEKWVALSSLSFMFPLQTQPNTKPQMSSGFCLYGADCTARAVFEKHLIRMIRCPCRAALNAVFFLYCYGFLWECGDRPHGGEGMAVLGKNKKFFFNFFSKKPHWTGWRCRIAPGISFPMETMTNRRKKDGMNDEYYCNSF